MEIASIREREKDVDRKIKIKPFFFTFRRPYLLWIKGSVSDGGAAHYHINNGYRNIGHFLHPCFHIPGKSITFPYPLGERRIRISSVYSRGGSGSVK